jgi:Na+-transporting methylmalonyl-CoA/oxaloacetate decarboxylase gamma subunit
MYDVFLTVVVIGIMIVLCYFTSGISNVPGSIFERKSTPEERAAEKGVARGEKKQTT